VSLTATNDYGTHTRWTLKCWVPVCNYISNSDCASTHNLSGAFLSSSVALSWLRDTYSVNWWTSLVTCCRNRHRFLSDTHIDMNN